MTKQANRRAFVNAVRARGGVKHFDLGGGVDLANGATATPQPTTITGAYTGITGQQASNMGLPATPTYTANPTGVNTTQGGVAGALTTQNQYNAQLAPTTQLNYTPVINPAANAALAGNQEFTGNLNNQQQLEQTFLNEGAGAGPNPAQTALAQNTGTNVSNTAALMAGQRGAAANPGLIAAQAAQTGAATQQSVVGQAATLQAQQELAAQQAAAGQQQNIASGVTSEQGANTSLFTGAAGAANTQNSNLIQNYAATQGINAATAAANTGATQKTAGGLLGGIASGIASIFAEGGEVESHEPANYDEGGGVPTAAAVGVGTGALEGVASDVGGPQSFVGKFLKSALSPGSANTTTDPFASGISNLFSAAGNKFGGVLGTNTMAKGGMAKKPVSGEMLAAKGKMVPGTPKVNHDSLKNDTVPAMLTPKEIVLPLSVTQAPDAAAKAAQFVTAVKAKERGRKKK